jgi:hypothetical protein
MVNNVYRRSFSYPMHVIQKACNLRYKDAYTSCYICNTKCNKCTKESYTYATKELQHQLRKPTTHTKITKDRLLEGRQKKGSTPPAKEQKSAKLTSSP